MADARVIQIADRRVKLRNGEQLESLECASSAVPPADLAQAIAQLGQAATPCRVTLVIPASWCYIHRISVPGRRPERSALAFAFEEFVPVDVETLTCDFLRTGNQAFIAVGIETQRIGPLLRALRETGIEVERITLDVIDAAAGSDADRLLWCDDEHAAQLEWSDGHVDSLRCVRLAAGPEDCWAVRVQERLGAVDRPTRVTGAVSRDRLAELERFRSFHPTVEGARCRQSQIADFNLARDALAPPSRRTDLLLAWRRAAVVAAAALLVLSVGLAVHRARLQARIGEIDRWQGAVFTELFPGQTVPAGVAMRLASERKRLEGLTLSSGPQMPERTDALAVMHQIVASLPPDLRLDLQEVRIENGNVTLRGRTRDHRGAEQLAAAVNKSGSLQCASPQTERQSDGGVLFYLHAQRVADDPARLASRDGRS